MKMFIFNEFLVKLGIQEDYRSLGEMPIKEKYSSTDIVFVLSIPKSKVQFAYSTYSLKRKKRERSRGEIDTFSDPIFD